MNDALTFTLCFDSNENTCFCLKERLKRLVRFPSVVSKQLLYQVFVLPWSLSFFDPSWDETSVMNMCGPFDVHFFLRVSFCLRIEKAKIDVYAGHPLSSADVVVSRKEKCVVLNTLAAPNANRKMTFLFSFSPCVSFLSSISGICNWGGVGIAEKLHDALFLTDADFR